MFQGLIAGCEMIRQQACGVRAAVTTSCSQMKCFLRGVERLLRLCQRAGADVPLPRPVRAPQGTLTHMAPEVLLAGRLSKASDVYAFGITLWELYTGGHAFKGGFALPQPRLHQAGPSATFLCYWLQPEWTGSALQFPMLNCLPTPPLSPLPACPQACPRR